MKTRTSIPFEALSGSAGEVTARSTRYGTVLSGMSRMWFLSTKVRAKTFLV